ncbi:killin [Muntiacus reevesi]|uniref:killin n=1 Tax=Muntiacus reevesi TaxID=9886 RepID=UPI003306C49F
MSDHKRSRRLDCRSLRREIPPLHPPPPEAAAPVSGRSRGGFKRRWRDTRATVGTTFRRRSRVLLVGELSKFPLPYDSCGGKCFASFARSAPALYGQRDPRASRVSMEEQAQTSLPLERCRSWLHKHPHPSTCPRLASPWLLPLILTDLGARVPKLVAPFARYPQSKLENRNLGLRALESLALPSQPWEKGLDFRGLAHLSR